MENKFRAEVCSHPIGETGDYDSWVELVGPDFNMQCYDPLIELEEIQELADMLNKTKELENGIDILRELCQLKKYKDEVGKDSFYQKRQPELWKLANEFLNQH